MANVAAKNYYAILGVNKHASEDEIKRAFHRLVRKYHPDVRPGSKEAEARFKDVNEAYAVLTDPAKRKNYDTLSADRTRGYQQGRRAAAGPRPYAPRAVPGAASGRFRPFGETPGRQRPSPREVAASLNLTLFGIRVGLRLISDLLRGLDWASSAERTASPRRSPRKPGARTDRKR